MAEKGKRVKQNQRGNIDEKIRIANSISIMDYANKNEMDILYEDAKIAKIEAPDGKRLTVYKNGNTWSHQSEGTINNSIISLGDNNNNTINGNAVESNEFGNTIRFVARMEGMPWRDAIDKLVQDRGDYLSSDEYNTAYMERYHSKEAQDNETSKAGATNTREASSERQKMKDISISEYAKALGLQVEDLKRGEMSVIKDPRFEGLFIYNKRNRWDWNSKFIHDGDIVKFAQGIENISREEALKSIEHFATTGLILKEKEPVKEVKTDPILKEEKATTPDHVKPEEASGIKEEAVLKQPKAETDSMQKDAEPKPGRLHKNLSKEQLSEILSGYRSHIDVTVYDNPELSPKQMMQLRIAKQHKVDAREFNDPTLSAEYMKELRLAAENGLDLGIFKDEKNQFIYSAEQAKEIRLGYQNGLSDEAMAAISKENLDSEAMKELRLGLQDGMEQMLNLGSGHYTSKDIHAIRMTLMVEHILDSIKTQLRNFYDKVIYTIKRAFEHKEGLKQYSAIPSDGQVTNIEIPELKDIEKAAVYEFRDTIESIYESMERELQKLSLEGRKEAIISALRTVIDQTLETENSQTANMEKEMAFEEAVESFVDQAQEEALRQVAYESLEEEYVEQFYQNENDYNEKLIDFSNAIINETTISREQKEDIFNRTLGVVFGEQTAEKWIKHLPVQESIRETNTELPNQNFMKMIQEEYEATLTTEEIHLEVG
jgi:hypothetical protein